MATLVGTLLLVATAAPARATSPLEQSLHVLVNATRIAHGTHTLGLSERLSRKAHRHSQRMAGRGTLFHSCLSCRFRGRHYRVLGENVGWGKSIQQVHNAMLNSSSHRSIILGGGFDRLGVGVVKRRHHVWVTEIFYG